jgi:hypothetical protein
MIISLIKIIKILSFLFAKIVYSYNYGGTFSLIIFNHLHICGDYMHHQLANILKQRSQLLKIMVNIISLLFRKYRMFYTDGRSSKYF